jgi:hypothetical protein
MKNQKPAKITSRAFSFLRDNRSSLGADYRTDGMAVAVYGRLACRRYWCRAIIGIAVHPGFTARFLGFVRFRLGAYLHSVSQAG